MHGEFLSWRVRSVLPLNTGHPVQETNYEQGARVPHSFFCPYFFGRGQRASTAPPIPPRGRNTPLTTAHFGLASRSTSSSTRVSIFSSKIPTFLLCSRYSFYDFTSSHSLSSLQGIPRTQSSGT